MTLATTLWLALTVAHGQEAGDICRPEFDPPRAGLECRPAFVEIEGETVPEWVFDPPQILNGMEGDVLLSWGCGSIGNLLRKVAPPQSYSHSGIMVDNRYHVRHSTGSDDRIQDFPDGSFGGIAAPTDGFDADVVRFVWPGTITEWIEDAYDGGYHADPVTGVNWRLTSFNRFDRPCASDVGGAVNAVLKPPPDLEYIDPDEPNPPAVNPRANLLEVAEQARGLDGHYRFSHYSDASMLTPAPASAGWAVGTEPTVCSSFIRRSAKLAGFTLEGTSLEGRDDEFVEILPTTPDGLYHYTEAERKDAGEWLYSDFEDTAYGAAGWFVEMWTDLSDDVAGQITNCFAHDFCGNDEGAPDGCSDDEEDAKDSDCWEEPGDGMAVAPDDTLRWDQPPDGLYGFKEDLAYSEGEFRWLWRWQAEAGTGSLSGTVVQAGTPQPGALVVVEGLTTTTTDSNGDYTIDAVPAGTWLVRACIDNSGGNEVSTLAADEDKDVDLFISGPCDPQADITQWHRSVRVSGSVDLVDHEYWVSDETGSWGFDQTVQLDPVTLPSHTFNWKSDCIGDEIYARYTVDVDLSTSDRTVDVSVTGRLYEGTSCDTDDKDGTGGEAFTLQPDATHSLDFVMTNTEEDDPDKATMHLTVENNQTPP